MQPYPNNYGEYFAKCFANMHPVLSLVKSLYAQSVCLSNIVFATPLRNTWQRTLGMPNFSFNFENNGSLAGRLREKRNTKTDGKIGNE